MAGPSVDDLCRVTVIAPGRRVDLALPVDLTVVELLPTLLAQVEPERVEAGVSDGWGLQRLGEDPLDLDRTLSAAGVRDGERLYLRPRPAALPPMVFDDVADAVATATQARPDPWSAGATRAVSLALTATALGFGAVLAAFAAPGRLVPLLVAGVLVPVCLLGALALSRAVGDADAATVVAAGGAGWAGALGLVASSSDPGGGLTAAGLAGGAAAVLITVTLSAAAVGTRTAGFVAAALAAGLTLLTAAGAALTGVPVAGAAGVLAAVVLAATPLLPRIALRLAAVPLPFVPLSAEELRKDTGQVPGSEVVARTAVADRYLTGLLGASAVLLVGACLLLTVTDSTTSLCLIAVVSAALALRARAFRGRAQRLWLLAAATATGAMVAGHLVAAASLVVQVLGLAGLVSVAAALVVAAVRPGQSPLNPIWGRVGDISELLLLVAVVPLTLGVLGTYGAVFDLVAASRA